MRLHLAGQDRGPVGEAGEDARARLESSLFAIGSAGESSSKLGCWLLHTCRNLQLLFGSPAGSSASRLPHPR